MNLSVKDSKFIWLPRILAIIFIIFISLFALEAFSGGATFPNAIMPFLGQLIPSFILIIILILSWRRSAVSGWIFILAGVAFMFYFNSYRFLTSFLIISLPPIIIGVLFLLPSMMGKKAKG